MTNHLEKQLVARGLPSAAGFVFQTMIDHVERSPDGDEGFKERLSALTDGTNWNANNSYEGMHPPLHLAESDLKPVESYGYFEVYIVFEARIKIPFPAFLEYMKVAAGHHVQAHPTETTEVQKLMTAFEAHVATLQKKHDRWLRDSEAST